MQIQSINARIRNKANITLASQNVRFRGRNGHVPKRASAPYISTANMPSVPVRAKFVRKASFTTAITACAFFIGVVFGHQHYSATSSRSLAKPTVDVAALEATIDVRDLPRQKLPLEVYQ